MSIEKHIDNMIKAAIARGEFDNLEGKGKPINLDAYFATPEDVRMGYSVLKSNDIVKGKFLSDDGELALIVEYSVRIFMLLPSCAGGRPLQHRLLFAGALPASISTPRSRCRPQFSWQ